MGRVSNAKERLMSAVMELIWTGSYGRTTIDQICAKAGVKKGSFYYFFAGKSQLAEAAIDAEWPVYRAQYDTLFSASVPPLERLYGLCEFSYQEQVKLKKQFGHVLGCPLCSLGAEVGTQEESLCRKIQEIMDAVRRYLESAIRDAHAQGLIHAPDAAAKSRTLSAYYEGLLTQARIQNNVEAVKEMIRGTQDVLGLRSTEPG